MTSACPGVVDVVSSVDDRGTRYTLAGPCLPDTAVVEPTFDVDPNWSTPNGTTLGRALAGIEVGDAIAVTADDPHNERCRGRHWVPAVREDLHGAASDEIETAIDALAPRRG